MKKSMTSIICIAPPKPGYGGTTTAVNLAAAFAALEQKTLLIDCDPRNRCVGASVIDPPADPPGLAQVFSGAMDSDSLLYSTRLEYLRILPAGYDLARSAADFAAMSGSGQGLDPLSGIKNTEWEMIVLNAPAGFGPLLQGAVCAADILILPLRLDLQAFPAAGDILQAHKLLLENVVNLRKKGLAGPRTARILIAGCDDAAEAEALLGPDLYDEIAHLCLPVCIPDDVRLHEALVLGKPVVCHDIASPGAAAFLELGAIWTDASQIRIAEKEEKVI